MTNSPPQVSRAEPQTHEMTMRKRVAQALQAAKIEGQRVSLSDEYADVLAGAAILAMREPTEAMRDAKYAAEEVDAKNFGRAELPPNTDNVWRAQIDTALSEKETP